MIIKETYHFGVETGDVVELLDFLLADVEFEGQAEEGVVLCGGVQVVLL